MTGEGGPAGGSRRRGAGRPEAAFEVAVVLRLLMARPWLVAGRDDEAISAVRRNLAAVREAFLKLGWVLVSERDFIRLRKSPPVRRGAWASYGPKPSTCCWFFLLVAAAESMPPKVAIGQLVGAARAAAAEAGLPAPGDMAERHAIIAALKMLHERHVVESIDGDIDGFLHAEDPPVLLAIHHHRLVHVVANFAAADPVTDPQGWLEQVEREPDPARRMRRRLLDDTVVHASDLDAAEADWLSRRVRSDDGLPLAQTFGLHLERRAEGAAFVVPSDAFRSRAELGDCPFPAGGTVAHASLLLCDLAEVDGLTDPHRPGWRGLPRGEVVTQLEKLAGKYGNGRGWSREDVDNVTGLAGKIQTLLAGVGLLWVDPSEVWWLSPAAGRWELPPTPEAGTGRTHRPARPQSDPYPNSRW